MRCARPRWLGIDSGLFLDLRADPGADRVLLVQPPHRGRRLRREPAPRRAIGAMIGDAFSSRWCRVRRGLRFSFMSAPKWRSARRWRCSSIRTTCGAVRRSLGRYLAWRWAAMGCPGISLQEAGKRSTGAGRWSAARSARRCWRGSTLHGCWRSFTAAACAMCLYVVAVGGVSAGFVALANRAVQLDHVPGDLHADAGTFDRQRGRQHRACCAPRSSAARSCRHWWGWYPARSATSPRWQCLRPATWC
jgi:hypothetical protein